MTAKIPVELNERLVATAEKFDRSKTDIIKAAFQSYFDSKDEAINAIPVELKERMTFIKLLHIYITSFTFFRSRATARRPANTVAIGDAISMSIPLRSIATSATIGNNLIRATISIPPSCS